MATGSENVEALWAEVDAATSSLGDRVQTLIDEINNTAAAGLTGPQTEAVLARLASLRDNLAAMGHNPQTPIPPAPPEPPEIPGPFA